jgi:hypothetical protein
MPLQRGIKQSLRSSSITSAHFLTLEYSAISLNLNLKKCNLFPLLNLLSKHLQTISIHNCCSPVHPIVKNEKNKNLSNNPEVVSVTCSKRDVM